MLKHIKGNSYFIEGVTNIGVIRKGNFCVLVDTGLDSDVAKHINTVLEENNLFPIEIINTHAHADHFGGNLFFKNKHNVKIIASKIEAGLIENAELEPVFLFSADPVKELKTKFTNAPSCKVDVVVDVENLEDGDYDNKKILSLPGHNPNQIGVMSEDNVLFLGDSVFTKKIIEKYKFPFMVSITQQRKTLEKLRSVKADLYIPGHGGVIYPRNWNSVIDFNLSVLDEIGDFIYRVLEQPMTREEIVRVMGAHFKAKLNAVEYYLAYTTVGAFLSDLQAQNKVAVEILDNKLLFRRVVKK